MARGATVPVLGVMLLLLAGHSSAQPLISQVGDLLLTLTSAVRSFRQFRNATATHRTSRAAANEPAAISGEPFSARVLSVTASGGPVYEWKAIAAASQDKLTVEANTTANVTFTTRYQRNETAFAPYTLKGQVELRNLKAEHVVLDGPVKVVVSLKRPPGVTTGPEVIQTPVYAACGKVAPIKVPARRGSHAGTIKCSFETSLPQAEALMRAAEAAREAAAAAAALGSQEAGRLSNGTEAAAAAAAQDATAPGNATADQAAKGVSNSTGFAPANPSTITNTSAVPASDAAAVTANGSSTVSVASIDGGAANAAATAATEASIANTAAGVLPAYTVVGAVPSGSAAAGPGVDAAALTAAAAAEPIVPDVSISVLATPLTGAASSASDAAAAAAPAVSEPYKAIFEVPEKACVVASEALNGPLAKYLIPSSSSITQGLRTICGSGGQYSYDAQLGNFDASACGTNTLTNAPGVAHGGAAAPVDTASAATVHINVVGCNHTRIARPDISITKLQVVNLFNTTWRVLAHAAPATLEAGAGGGRVLRVPVNGTAAARFVVNLVKGPPQELGYRLRGEISVATASLIPSVLSVARVAITSAAGATSYVDLHCPPPVIIGSTRCAFDAPWPAGGAGSVQAQLRTFASRAWDVTSGTPKAFDFSRAQDMDLGACVSVERTYTGRSIINGTHWVAPGKPLAGLVSGVDSLLGTVGVNLTHYGLPASSVGEITRLLNLPVGRRRRVLLAGGEGEVLVGRAANANATSAVMGGSEAEDVSDPFDAAALALMPFVHPLKVLSGAVPPGPRSGNPLKFCSNHTLSWTELFGGAKVDACGDMYNALSNLLITPDFSGAGAQPVLSRNVSLPVLIAGCALTPTAKLLAMHSAAAKAHTWSVSAQPQDKKTIDISQPSHKPAVAKFQVTFNRTTTLTNFTLEPAMVLLNPFAKPLNVAGVYATISINGLPDVVSALLCKGAVNGSTSFVLPPTPSAGVPVPIGCVGSIPLPGPAIGTISVTTVTTSAGNITSPHALFDTISGVDDISAEEGRCATVTGAFAGGRPAGSVGPAPVVAGLVPAKVGGNMPPQSKVELCEPRKFVFNATFGPFADKFTSCGSFMARYVATIPGARKSSSASTPINVRGCAAPLPLLSLASLKPVNVVSSYAWSVTRKLVPQATPKFNGLLSLRHDQSQLLDHVVSFTRSPASKAAVSKHHAVGVVNITNPSDKLTLAIAGVHVLLVHKGAPNITLNAKCPGSGKGGAVSLRPLETLRCTFDGVVADARPSLAQAVALLADGRHASSTNAPRALSFQNAQNASEGDCANVWDDFRLLSSPWVAKAGSLQAANLRYVGEQPPSIELGEAPLRICASKVFRQTAQLGPFGSGGCGSYTYGGKAVVQPLSGLQNPVATAAGKLLDVLVGKC